MAGACVAGARDGSSPARRVVLGMIVALTAVLGSAHRAAAQDPAPEVVVADAVVEVRLADGSVLIGRVAEVEGSRVVLMTPGGARVELDRSQVRSVRPIRGEIRNGQVWEPDANATRLFFGPTGRTMPAGDAYLGVYELFFPFVTYAPTGNVLLSAGTPIMPEIIGEVFYLAPKVRLLSRGTLDVAVGVLAMFAPFERDFDNVGIVYGTGTVGPPDAAVTLGAGWTFAGGDLTNKPVFMGGAERRVGRRVKLLTENYLFLHEETTYDAYDPGRDPQYEPTGRTHTEAAGLLSGGVRLFGERLSADLGLGLFIEPDDVLCCLPLVNFVYSF